MIPRTLTQNTDWKNELRQAVTRPEQLLELLDLPRSRWLTAAKQAAQLFPLKVPLGFVRRMQKGNPLDPLLLQVMPLGLELETHAKFCTDPVGDGASTPMPGLIHKYRQRALVITTGACAVNCRYCFRRHYPYSESAANNSRIENILQYLSTHREVNEVILSGGDPLMLDDHRLGDLLRRISSIDHVRWLRIHSRLPIVLPERITRPLLQQLNTTKPVTMVIHCNHPNELDDQVKQALQELDSAGIRLYNQSVLLKGVNDDAETLCELSHALFSHRVQPYYLHVLDRVQGAAHFDLGAQQVASIYRQMQASLSGLMLPRLVREDAGAPSKTLINIDRQQKTMENDRPHQSAVQDNIPD
jgi:EF-P beta-lysylation protein EpmB